MTARHPGADAFINKTNIKIKKKLGKLSIFFFISLSIYLFYYFFFCLKKKMRFNLPGKVKKENKHFFFIIILCLRKTIICYLINVVFRVFIF